MKCKAVSSNGSKCDRNGLVLGYCLQHFSKVYELKITRKKKEYRE
jgi:hypothetical protein